MCGPHNNNSGYPEVYVQKMSEIPSCNWICNDYNNCEGCQFNEEVKKR